MENTVNNTIPEQKKSSGMVKWIAGGAMGALLIANGFLYHRVSTLETDLSNQRATSQTQFAQYQETSASSAAAMSQGFEEISAKLEEGTKTSTAEAKRAAAGAQSTAQKNAEKLIAQLKEERMAREAEFQAELGNVREESAAKVASVESSVGTVNEKVGAVQQEVATAKTAIDQTLSDLKSVRGDLGVQSGLIATNARELAALRDLGERNYVEFTIAKNKPTRVANMTLELKKADTKRNKYNVNVSVDDKKVEKKDRTINEPVQMYVAGARQPYEIVVNEVKKDTIVGYVAVPKVTLRAAR
jgi:chromosome segregation ATPase